MASSAQIVREEDSDPTYFGVVSRTPEFERIYRLPRRALDLVTPLDLTPLFAKRKEGGIRLKPIQNAALYDAAYARGLFAPIKVGGGKGLLALLLPEVFDAKRAVIFTEGKLKRTLMRSAVEKYSDLKIPFDRFRVFSYGELSSHTRGTGLLDEYQPDAIICDEAHALRNPKSARTIRFMNYANKHRDIPYAFLSGTMVRDTLKDFAHLIELALGEGSPVPNVRPELIAWCGAIDRVPEYPYLPGVLTKFCTPGETTRAGYSRKFFDTPGVVGDFTEDEVCASLTFTQTKLVIPPSVVKLRDGVARNWKLGDMEMRLAIEQSKAQQQLSCGFFYRWVWPNGRPDTEWLTARAEYHAEMRARLKHASKGLDSPYHLTNAAKRYWNWKRKGGPRPEKLWPSKTWPRWEEVRQRYKPLTETIWVSEFLVDAAIDWARKAERGAIIWYTYKALGERIAEKGGFPLYGPGAAAEFATEPIIVCSVKAQGTGQNLQDRFHKNLLTTVPPNAQVLQQLVGRTHRPYQAADVVTVDWYGTGENIEAFETAKAEAEFQQELFAEPQKILYGTHVK